MTQRRHGGAQWLAWLREQPESGLSVSAFCRKKGISENSFYVWRRKLANELALTQTPSSFVGLTLIDQVPVSIELPGGARIQVTDESSLRTILRLLVELSPEQ
jgi:transposase-like protein